jgi:hypothetical protein
MYDIQGKLTRKTDVKKIPLYPYGRKFLNKQVTNEVAVLDPDPHGSAKILVA